MIRVASLTQSSVTRLRDLTTIYGYLKNKNSELKKKLSEKSVEGIKK